MQKYEGIWHLVAYYSPKITPPKLNYDIYDKELLRIVTVLKEWRAFLQRTVEPFTVKTDHKNLTGFLTTKELNKQQVKWAEMLSKYHFKIKHIKKTNNAKTNTLSQQTELQKTEKPSGAMLKLHKDGKIKYNHLKLTAI